ncbi:MAG: C25 family cysteine peptidase [bacterium]|nr:C25 family cysteine peptidase [bacterium]
MFLVLIFSFSLQVSFPLTSEKAVDLILKELTTELPVLYYKGRPSIPAKTLSFSLKGFKGVEVKPVQVETIKVNGIIPPTLPPQVLSMKTVKEENPFDSLFYSEKAFYPDSYFTYRVITKGVDTTLELILFPFRYNPGDSVAEYIRIFSIRIEGEITKQGFYQPLYLIIAPQNFRDFLNPLIRLRKQKGYKVVFKALEEIFSEYQGRNDAEKIRNFLKMYSSYEGERFLLLVGDETLIPLVYLYAFDCQAGFMPNENDIPSDLYYADIDGDYDANGNMVYGEVEDSVELYPDFYVGRLPVKDTVELANYLYKLLGYEVAPDNPSLLKAVFLAQILWEIPYTDQSIHKENIRKKFLPPDYIVFGFYESYGNAIKSEIINSLNSGVNLVNHDGHGWITAMWFGNDFIGISDTVALTNVYTPFFLYSIGCWVGAMDYPSLAEALVTARGGALGVVANSRYGWGAPGNPGFGYSDIFDNEFFKLLFKNQDDELGKVFWNHKASFAPLARDSNVYRWCYYEINLFGDPALYLWREKPKELEIFSKDIGDTNIRLVVGYDGQPLSGVTATLMVGDSVLAVKKSDFSGIISLDIDTLCDSVLITLWKPSFHIYSEWVELKRRDIVFDVKVKNDGSFRDWVWAGENNILSLTIANGGESPFADTISLSSSGLLFDPDRISVNLQTGESLRFDVICIVPESLKKNTVKTLRIRSRKGESFHSLKIAWPSIRFVSYASGDSSLILRFVNSSFMRLKGRVLGVYEVPGLVPLGFYNDSLLVESQAEFTLETDVPKGRNLRLFFEFNGIYLKFDISLIFDSELFYTDFERMDKWYGDTTYFCLSDQAGPFDKYLTYKDEFAPFPLQAKIYSERFRLNGKFKLGLYFTYSFPIYGTTGVKISLRKEWLSGGDVLRTEVEDIAFLGAGGALDEKSIYGNWAYYQYEGEVEDNPDYVRVLITFTKDSSSETYWGLDEIKIVSAEEDIVRKEELSFEGVKILNFPMIVRGGSFRFLLLSQNSEFINLGLFDVNGRLIKSFNFALAEGINELVVPLLGIKSGVYFVKILDKTKRMVIVK